MYLAEGTFFLAVSCFFMVIFSRHHSRDVYVALSFWFALKDFRTLPRNTLVIIWSMTREKPHSSIELRRLSAASFTDGTLWIILERYLINSMDHREFENYICLICWIHGG